MQLHLHYLSAGATNWREYLNYLAEQLKVLVSFTRILNEQTCLCLAKYWDMFGVLKVWVG